MSYSVLLSRKIDGPYYYLCDHIRCVCVCVRVRVRMCVCVPVCVRACVRACARAGFYSTSGIHGMCLARTFSCSSDGVALQFFGFSFSM